MAKTVATKAQKSDRFTALPKKLLTGVFVQVSYCKDGEEVEIAFRFLFPPTDEWHSVVAIDASESMRSLFGRALIGDIPLEVQEQYHRKNLVFEETREGNLLRFYQAEAYEDAVAKKYLKWTHNEIEPKAREIIEYLAKRVDVRKSCNLMYWGCSKGLGWVDLGEIEAEKSSDTEISSPGSDTFGNDSKLLPLVQYLVSSFIDVPRSIFVILTDGNFSDAEDVKTFCISLALLIKAKQRHFMKFVAIGMGKDVNQKILSEFAGMKTGPTTELWDFKMADDMNSLDELLAGTLADEEIVAPKAVIYDANGKVVKEFKDGLPASASFRMPLSSTSFSIEIPPGKKFQQSLLLPFRKTLF